MARDMPVGVRELDVLEEFKPFRLVAESLDGSPSTMSHKSTNTSFSILKWSQKEMNP
ncbi:hypothetical protein Dimus_022581, partial [Dionaea muscipula]